MSHAIPTVYRGIEYRSRLEARWAAFFDEIGWKYTYEPFDGNGYIPDFLIHGDMPLLAEIKPAVTEDDYRAPIPKIQAGLEGHWERDILILGIDPLPAFDRGDETWSDADLFAGVLGPRSYCHQMLGGVYIDYEVWVELTDELRQQVERVDSHGRGWDFGMGIWFRCLECDRISMSWGRQRRHGFSYSNDGRPCGHADHWNNTHIGDVDPDEIKSAWAEACNAVKWYGRNAS